MDNKEREDILAAIERVLIEGRHVGWRNAIKAKSLAQKVGVGTKHLRADRSNPNTRGLIGELRKRGVAILSYVTGYYLPDPANAEEDYAKHKRWTRNAGVMQIKAHSDARKAPKVKTEQTLFGRDDSGNQDQS